MQYSTVQYSKTAKERSNEAHFKGKGQSVKKEEQLKKNEKFINGFKYLYIYKGYL